MRYFFYKNGWSNICLLLYSRQEQTEPFSPVNLKFHQKMAYTIKFRPIIPSTIKFNLFSPHFQTISTAKSTTITSSCSIHYPELPNQWTGLHNWRRGSLNHHRFWGPNGPDNVPQSSNLIEESALLDSISSASSLAEMGAAVLSTSDPLLKSKLTHLGYCRWRQEGLPIGNFEPPVRPARPSKPHLVCFSPFSFQVPFFLFCFVFVYVVSVYYIYSLYRHNI